MSLPVELGDLSARVAEYGEHAFLISVGDGGPPHVSSVIVSVTASGVRVGAGKRTRANVAARPDVSLVWPQGPDGSYCLIVDGTVERAEADADADTLDIRPTSAVLHRLAGAPGNLPQCLPLEQP